MEGAGGRPVGGEVSKQAALVCQGSTACREKRSVRQYSRNDSKARESFGKDASRREELVLSRRRKAEQRSTTWTAEHLARLLSVSVSSLTEVQKTRPVVEWGEYRREGAGSGGRSWSGRRRAARAGAGRTWDEQGTRPVRYTLQSNPSHTSKRASRSSQWASLE